ncbi:MAG: AAA family ATPase [Pseudomonadota bacterium]
MNITYINQCLSQGNLADVKLFPHLYRLSTAPFIFEHDFGLKKLPLEPGILLIRGARQYGKSTWLEQQIVATIKKFGAGSAFYLNGDYLFDANDLHEQLEALAVSFTKNKTIKRIFIDEITTIAGWEVVLKRLVDSGVLVDILVITTGSKAPELRRGAERLPGRKGKLAKTNYLFTPISYKSFYHACHKKLKTKTLIAYLISGGSPIACSELATQKILPEYVIQLVRDWIEGEIAKIQRHRSALLNIFNVLFRFGANPVGQAKLAREANLANNTVAQGYIEILHDLGCVIPAFPYDFNKQNLILRKPCKYHYMNMLVAVAYHPARIRSVEEFLQLPDEQQGIWYEWLIAQELQRRAAIQGAEPLQPLAFWQNKSHEIDFYDMLNKLFIEAKKGSYTPLEFAWFTKQFNKGKLKVINKNHFETARIHGLTLEAFLLDDNLSN